MVLKSDVAGSWPFAEGEAAAPISGPVYHKGAPGRPTSMHLVEIEHAARWDRGEALESIVAESEALATWLKTVHPSAARLTPKTIRNNLSLAHRQRMAARA